MHDTKRPVHKKKKREEEKEDKTFACNLSSIISYNFAEFNAIEASNTNANADASSMPGSIHATN